MEIAIINTVILIMMMATLFMHDTCPAGLFIRVASAIAAMARLNLIWRNNTVSFASNLKLHKSVLFSTLLYDCKTWTLLADSDNNKKNPKKTTTTTTNTQAFEAKCLRKLLRISCLVHKINHWVQSKIKFLVGPQELLAANVK